MSDGHQTIAAPARAGPYWFLAALGRGGMADVFLVAAETPVGFSKIEVLKRPRGDFDEDDDLSMFLDEGRLAARLNHPNVLRTTDVAIYDGRPCITMEYVEGQSLHRLAHDDRQGRVELDRDSGLFIIQEVLQGLAHAHDQRDFDGTPLGIVHRDLSPGNVLLSHSGEVKICDFGIAWATSRLAHTQPGVVKGKASYMAPEQFRSGEVDRRADIYAVGVLLWEILARRPLFAESEDALRGRRPPRLSEVLDDVDPRLDAVCAKALSSDPADRYQSAEEMLEALEEATSGISPMGQRKTLGRLLEGAYGAERTRRSELVRARLEEVKSGSANAVTMPKFTVSTESLPPEPTSVSLRPTPEGSEPKVSARSRRRSPALTGAVAAVLVGTALGVAVVVSQQSGIEAPVRTARAPAASPASTTPATQTPPAEVDEEPASEPVELVIDVAPPHAKVFFDGEPVKGSPAVVERPPSSEEHRIVVRAPGYEPVERTVVLERDVGLRVSLKGYQAAPAPWPAPSAEAAVRPRAGGSDETDATEAPPSPTGQPAGTDDLPPPAPSSAQEVEPAPSPR